MLLIYPPIAKASEPPAGISLLAGALRSSGIRTDIQDMNLGAQEFLLNRYFEEKPRKRHYLEQLRGESAYKDSRRYERAVQELTTGLNHRQPEGIRITLANYSDQRYDPLKSSDLLRAAGEFRDSPFYPYFQERMASFRDLQRNEPIGVSLQFIQQALPAFALLGFLKETCPENPLILGGGLINSWSCLKSWDNPFGSLIDRVITGPGEIPLLDYLNVPEEHRPQQPPRGDYSWTRGLGYLSPGPILPLAGSSGCGWKGCRFCPERSEKAPYHSRKTRLVLEEKQALEKEYSPRLIHFLDNEMSPALLKALAAAGPGTAWYGFTRFYPRLKDSSFCKDLKNSGCAMLKLGLESGDQLVLNQMNKGVQLEDVPAILRNLKNAGIRTYVYLLFGTPEEDIQSARKTMAFVEAHADYISYLNRAIFNMPLQADYPESADNYRFSDGDLSLYRGFNHPAGWNRREIRNFLKEEFRKQPGISAVIQRTPPQFNANHGALMYNPCIIEE